VVSTFVLSVFPAQPLQQAAMAAARQNPVEGVDAHVIALVDNVNRAV